MTDFASSALHPQTGISRFYFQVGSLYGLMTTVLVVGAVVGMFQRPVHPVYRRVMEVFSIVLAVASVIVSSAYILEFWIAAHASNRFNSATFVGVRWTGLYSIIYSASVASVLVPQLFWWKRLRRSLTAILVIAGLAAFGVWFERVVIAITSLSQDFLPSSWSP